MSFKGLWAISLNSGIHELQVSLIRFTHRYDSASHHGLPIRNFTTIAWFRLTLQLRYHSVGDLAGAYGSGGVEL